MSVSSAIAPCPARPHTISPAPERARLTAHRSLSAEPLPPIGNANVFPSSRLSTPLLTLPPVDTTDTVKRIALPDSRGSSFSESLNMDLPAEFPPADPDKTAFILGFGAIGRGFLAEIFRRGDLKTGYTIVGADSYTPLVDTINREGSYTIHIQGEHPRLERVDNVHVIHASDSEAVIKGLSQATIAGMALMEKDIPAAAERIAQALVLRDQEKRGDLTLVIALNKLEGGEFVTDQIKQALDKIAPDQAGRLLRTVQVIETVVNRIARNPNETERKTDPAAVFTEPYFTLPARNGAKILSEFVQIQPVENLAPYEDLKILASNGPHAVTAYMGAAKGYDNIQQAIADPEILKVVTAASNEAFGGVIHKWGNEINAADAKAYQKSVLLRFTKTPDAISRVAREPIRKLGRHDRLVGNALLALTAGREPKGLATGIAYALRYRNPEDPQSIEVNDMVKQQGIEATLIHFGQLETANPHHQHLIGLVRDAMANLDRNVDYTQGLSPEVAAKYQEIKDHQGAQKANYQAYISTLRPEYKQKLSAQLADIGIRLDWNSGHIFYSDAFKPLPLTYTLEFERHGKTIGNTEPRIYQGQVDEPVNQLNSVGKQQAELGADEVAKRNPSDYPDVVMLSPLSRARETGMAIVNRLNLKDRVVINPRIAEMAFGSWDNQRVIDVPVNSIAHQFYLDQNALVKADKPFVSPTTQQHVNPENFAEVLLRAKDALLALNNTCAGKKVLMVSHSMFGAAVSILMGKGQTCDAGNLGFDGKCIIPHAKPFRLN